MRRLLRFLSPGEGEASQPLPALRPGVILAGDGDEAELRDLQLGQVVKLGEAAARIVTLLDGTRSAEELLVAAGELLGEEVNPLGLVELLQALDRRALLDTPRARAVATQGLVRADIAALNRAAQRSRNATDYVPAGEDKSLPIRTTQSATFSCHSCNRCCSERNVLGPIRREERDRILDGFSSLGQRYNADPSHFIPLPGGGGPPIYLMRTQGGFCTYLERDGLCRIHSELGEEFKPDVCRAYPFRAVRTPSGWDVGMSVGCPTVASGGGDDATELIERTIHSLGSRFPGIRRMPLAVRLRPGATVAYERYAAWEEATLEALADESVQPIETWLKAMDSFHQLADSAQASGTDEDSSETIPSEGVGEPGESTRSSTDTILRDLTLWAELLVGLEPTDPIALRRFRSGVLRVRLRLGEHGDDAPVLAENARRLLRTQFPDEGVGWLTAETLEASPLSDDGAGGFSRPPEGSDASVQRRFLSQSLMEKRVFEYGSVARGLLSLSLLTAILSLDILDGDELQPGISDVAFLAGHTQLVDLFDTRASVRAVEDQPEAHRLILAPH